MMARRAAQPGPQPQPQPRPQTRPWRGGAALRDARTCYDHLAGRLGVALAEAWLDAGYVRPTDSGMTLTAAGERFLARAGMVLPISRRPVCRACLDWSERRPHLAGALGAALAAHAFARGWIERIPGGRAVRVTETGHAGFARELGAAMPP